MFKQILNLAVSCLFLVSLGISQEVSPSPMQWHKVTVSYTSDDVYSETGTPNPFTERRLDVVFSKGALSYKVPGYFAADGNAGNTSASSGKIWKVHFSPPETGTWTYKGSFYHGTDIHAQTNPTNPTKTFEGTFNVVASNKSPTGKDLRGKGWLQYVGKRYLKFKGTGEYFLKQGPDSPENLFAFKDFDGDFKTDGIDDNKIKTFPNHLADWKTGDPTWGDGKGKGLIGVINYLASEGLNVFSFISMSIKGDDENSFPYIAIDKLDRIDVSRMDQWEVVFDHATSLGFFIHFKTQETENECLQDNCEVGRERKLYYRELIARFAHHPALNWNLGEENGAYDGPNQNTAQRRAMAAYFWDNDPYNHHIVLHNPLDPDDMYGTDSKLTGWSLQQGAFSTVPPKIKEILDESAKAGKQWAVAADETGGASSGIKVDSDPSNHKDGRRYGIWATYLVGGWGNEWYFGGEDQSNQDFKTRDKWWDYCRYALEFFQKNHIPLWDMASDDAATSVTNDRVLSLKGQVYLIALPDGGTTNLTVPGLTGSLDIKWYNPRTGGDLKDGSVKTLTASGGSIGNPPTEGNEDWVVLVGANKITSIKDSPKTSYVSNHLKLDWSTGKVLKASLKLESTVNQIQVTVHHFHGALYSKQPISTQNKQAAEFSIDLAGIPAGLYVVKVVAGSNVYSQKVVVP